MLSGMSTSVFSTDSITRFESPLLLNRGLPLSEEADTLCQRTVRISAKVFTSLLALLGGVSPMAASLKLAGTTIIGYVLLGTNYFAFFSNTSWAFHSAIDEEIKRLKFAKREVNFKQEISLVKQGILKITVLVLSAASIVPDIYNAYYYNSGKIVFPILTCVCGIGLPFYSLNLSFKAMLRERSQGALEESLGRCRSEIKSRLHSIKLELVSLLSGQRRISRVNSESELAERLNAVLELLSEREEQPLLTAWQKLKRWTSVGLGYVNGAIGITALAIYNLVLGAKAVQLIYDQPYFYYSAALFILVSNGIVPAQVVMRNSLKLFEKLFSKPWQLLTGESALGQLMPVKRGLAGAVALTLAALSVGPALQAVNDSFKERHRLPMQIALLDAVFFLTFNSINYLTDEGMKIFCAQLGSNEQRNTAKWEQYLDQLIDDIDKYSFRQFAQFLIKMPEEQFKVLAGDCLNQEELENYIGLDNSAAISSAEL